MRIIVILSTAIALSGCTGSESSPTSPTPPAPPTPVATSLSGTVSSSTGGTVPGAVVTISDGANAGRSATTATNGTYRIDGLTASNGNVLVRANGFEDNGNGTFLTGSTTMNFTLRAIFFNVTGRGNAVFDLPRRSTRMRIYGRWSGTGASNFIVRPVGGISLVNAILREQNPYEGTHTTSGGPIEIVSSENIIEWRFTEVQ